MNDIVVQSLQYLSDEGAQASAIYLDGLAPIGDAPHKPIDDAIMSAGLEVYAERCQECHRSSGSRSRASVIEAHRRLIAR